MKYSLLLFAVLCPVVLAGQNVVGLETQAYPAGLVPGVHTELHVAGRSYLTARLGYNFTDRRDWGVHDNEEGGGAGFSLGYMLRDFFAEGLNLNLQSDLWFMDIEWTDRETICPIIPPCYETDFSSNTELTVLQPTVGLSYDLWERRPWLLKPSMAFGYEINVRTRGEAVGEGAIFLLGLNLDYQF